MARELNGVVPTAVGWLTMRANKDKLYFDFFDKFVKHVVGVANFKSSSTSKYVSSFVKISDEAFALLVLENCETRWRDMLRRGVTKSKLPCKYTDGGLSLNNGRSRTHKGWSNAGLTRYNELFREVRSDRSKPNQPFEGQYMLHRMENFPNKAQESRGARVNYSDDEISCGDIEDEMEDFQAPIAMGQTSGASAGMECTQMEGV
jgi:hypothetical protein